MKTETFDLQGLLELTLGTVVVDHLILILVFHLLHLRLARALVLVLVRVTEVCCVVIPLCCV